VEQTTDNMYHTFFFNTKKDNSGTKSRQHATISLFSFTEKGSSETYRKQDKSVFLYKEVKYNNIKFCSFELVHVQITNLYVNPTCKRTLVLSISIHVLYLVALLILEL